MRGTVLICALALASLVAGCGSSYRASPTARYIDEGDRTCLRLFRHPDAKPGGVLDTPHKVVAEADRFRRNLRRMAKAFRAIEPPADAADRKGERERLALLRRLDGRAAQFRRTGNRLVHPKAGSDPADLLRLGRRLRSQHEGLLRGGAKLRRLYRQSGFRICGREPKRA